MNRLAKYVILLCLGVFVTASVTFGTNTNTNVEIQQEGERFLLVFDISAKMRSRLPATTNFLRNLLGSGFFGQAKPGDTIGVWTFNDFLYTGEFQLRVWSPARTMEIWRDLCGFLAKRRYEGKAQFSDLVDGMDVVVKRSRTITIMIFTDGKAEFVGSPFDEDINASFKNLAPAAEKAKEPIIVVLRAYKGQLIGSVVARASQGILFPRYPETTEKVKPATVLPTNSVQQRTSHLLRGDLIPLPTPTSEPAGESYRDASNAPQTTALAVHEPPKSAAPLQVGRPGEVVPVIQMGGAASNAAGQTRDTQPLSEKTVADLVPAQRLADIGQRPPNVDLPVPPPGVERDTFTKSVLSPESTVEEKRSSPEPVTSAAERKAESVGRSVMGVVTSPVRKSGSPVENAVGSNRLVEDGSKQSVMGDLPAISRILIGVGVTLSGLGLLLVGSAIWYMIIRRPKESIITQAMERRNDSQV